MEKYQIFETLDGGFHAGTKANGDIADIAERLGYEKVIIRQVNQKDSKIAKLQRQLVWKKDFNEAFNKIENNSIVLLQNPFHHNQLTRNRILKKLKTQKNVKYISIIHDVEKLRAFRYNDYYKNEFDFMLEIGDVFIVHNEKMLKYFESLGVESSKLINLEIFDYLDENIDEDKKISFEKSITVAGNLDTTKCGYIGELGNLGIKVNLFGPNFDEQMKNNNNITYFGSFPPNDIPSHLNKGFGLVWDGTSINGCQGQSGQYLKYNNPHKLSLYLSSGLPVVIWKDAAEAKYVMDKKVGIAVGSLMELKSIFDDMDENSYYELCENVKFISKKLRKGHFATKAIKEAEALL
ncbi:sugar transferase [Sharpea azabuensis]|uniref:Beta-1,6-galactofuranosyltransferase n=1 Tax=Sharpea azabuensis TaxID=322505 RepID=A0A1H6V1R7_9FIRM|nr:sugar transferase [Sharpea azabuensis]SEI94560.1 hypothetical protein SAMN04487834_103714 [Sharpea azabuensis]